MTQAKDSMYLHSFLKPNIPFANDLSKQLDYLLGKVAETRNVIIAPHVKEFTKEIIIESIMLGAQEWEHLYNLRCSFKEDHEEIIAAAIQCTEKILNEVDVERYNNYNCISVRNILKYIHNHWCGVFPYCRDM